MTLPTATGGSSTDFLAGDVACCFGRDLVGRVISLGTCWPFAPRRLRMAPSHVAFLFEHNGSTWWGESTTLCAHPCVIRRLHTSGCQAHFPESRIADYVDAGGRVDLYRLVPIDRFNTAESERLTSIFLRYFIGRGVGYDMGGAVLSGTRLLQLTSLMPAANQHSIFCSALIAALWQRLGRMNRTNPLRMNPGRLMRLLVRQGVYQFERTYTPTSP